MDLEELKKSWKKIDEQVAPLEKESILKLVQKNTQSPLSKLRKSMFTELGILVLFVGILASNYLLGNYNHSIFVRGFIIGFVLLSIAAQIYFASRIFKNSNQITFNNTVKDQLKSTIKELKKDLKFYKLYNLGFYMPAIFVGFLMVNKAVRSFASLSHLDAEDWWIAGGVTLALAIPYYFFVKWWSEKLYGKYITQLEETYQEIIA